MQQHLINAAPYAAGLLGLAALTTAILLAFEVYASPGFSVSAAFMRLCGL